MSKVWKSTGFALIAALLLCTAPDWSGAQNAGPDEPLKLEDGKIRIAGTASDVSLESLIEHYVEATGRIVLSNRLKLRNANVDFVAPSEGKTVSPEDALRVALLQYRLVLVKHGEFDEIVSAIEAISYVDIVTEADLGARHPLEFIRFVYRLNYADANTIRGVLQNMTSRQGGQVNPFFSGAGGKRDVPGAILICDEAGNVQDLLKLIKILDKPRKAAKPRDD